MENKDIVIQQLVSMRQQVDAMGSQIDAALSLLVGPDPDEGCSHPPDKRQPLGMGNTAWQCKKCGYIHQGGD
jgi:hypothetical protein